MLNPSLLRSACAIVLLACFATPPVHADSPDPPSLSSARTQSPSRGWRHWLRKKVESDKDRAKYGLHLDAGWKKAKPETPVVILIHGFNSTPERSFGLIADARDKGLACGAFAYPNDQPLRASAELLSQELRTFNRQHPQRSIALVTHSMGGLVARECIEDAKLRPRNMKRLIMVAPPTHGSMLARYAVGLDLWEHWLNRRSGNPWRRTRDAIVDGLSEAPGDLCPGSKFLTQLNARSRCPDCRYTVLLGSSARVTPEQRFIIRKSLSATARCTPCWDADPDKIDRLIANMDELVEGRGDGAVAICRGRLAGVEDTHVLPFDHISVIGTQPTGSSRKVQRIILSRLVSDSGA